MRKECRIGSKDHFFKSLDHTNEMHLIKVTKELDNAEANKPQRVVVARVPARKDCRASCIDI